MRKAQWLAVLFCVLTLASCISPAVKSGTTASVAPTPIAAPSPTAVFADALMQTVQKLSDRELIGQMVMIGFEGTEAPSEDLIRLMRDYKVGNVILFGWNLISFAQTKELTAKITAYNPLPSFPMLISTDAEGGSVYRLPFRPITKSAYQLGKAGDALAVYAQYKSIGEQLLSCGITVNLAPVLDIAKSLDGKFLAAKQRMFGTDAESVSMLITSAVRGLHDAGVLSFGKHFPGHGNTATDSHLELPVIETTLTDWRSYDSKPFAAAINQGIDGMLVGHLSYPLIDQGNIASLSPILISDLLRRELGFTGIVMSDDMRMQALSDTVKIDEAAVRFIEAGGDFVLIGRYTTKQIATLDGLYNALQSGRLTRARLEQSVYRILIAKQKLIQH